MPEVTPVEWADFLSGFPEAHILQTRPWGDLKSAFGWQSGYVLASAGKKSMSMGAQILFRRLPLGLSVAYIAKGPVGSGGGDLAGFQALWPEVDRLCRKRNAIFLKVEPDLWERAQTDGGISSVPSTSPPKGFRPGDQSIQPRRTLVVDLSGSEEQVLARMKQKTRYNIRLAAKKGVVITPSEDIEAFHRLMMITSERDFFGVHSLAYYRRAYELFAAQGDCAILTAEFEGEPLAALMVFRRGKRAWYFYGASGNAHRERMPTYLLQWEAIRWARAQQCTSYDLWGVPDADEQSLEDQFMQRSGGLWGVYRFKRGFGGELMRSLGPYDRVYRPAFYALYRLWYKRKANEQS